MYYLHGHKVWDKTISKQEIESGKLCVSIHERQIDSNISSHYYLITSYVSDMKSGGLLLSIIAAYMKQYLLQT